MKSVQMFNETELNCILWRLRAITYHMKMMTEKIKSSSSVLWRHVVVRNNTNLSKYLTVSIFRVKCHYPTATLYSITTQKN